MTVAIEAGYQKKRSRAEYKRVTSVQSIREGFQEVDNWMCYQRHYQSVQIGEDRSFHKQYVKGLPPLIRDNTTCGIISLFLPQGLSGSQEKDHPHPPGTPLSALTTHLETAKLSSAPPRSLPTCPASTSFPALNPLVLPSCSTHSKNLITHGFALLPHQASPKPFYGLSIP